MEPSQARSRSLTLPEGVPKQSQITKQRCFMATKKNLKRKGAGLLPLSSAGAARLEATVARAQSSLGFSSRQAKSVLRAIAESEEAAEALRAAVAADVETVDESHACVGFSGRDQ